MKKKLLFSITNLEIGGAEKVLVDLVNKLKQDYNITLLLLYGNGPLEKNIASDIKIIHLYDKKEKDVSLLKRKTTSLKLHLKRTRQQIIKKYSLENYDLVIAFLEGPVTSLLQDIKCKKIAWIHTDISTHYDKKRYKDLTKTYQKYNKIIFVSKDSKTSFDKVTNHLIESNKKEVIHNYFDKDTIIKKSREKIDFSLNETMLNFIVVARLTQAKAIDRLLKAHQKVIKDNYPHHIYVIGDGPLKEELMSLKNELQVEETFHFLGQKENPYPFIKKGTYLLLPSLYEGYPVTLLEGMTLNKFIIITDIASKEVLENYPNKYIMENNLDGIITGLKEVIKTHPRIKEDYQMMEGEYILSKIKDMINKEME